MGAQEDRQTITQALSGIVKGTQNEVRVILMCNLLIGLGWLIGAESRTATAVYAPAKWLLQSEPIYAIRIYGLVLIVISLTALVMFLMHRPRTYRVAMLCLMAFWIFWAFLYCVAFFLGSSSGIAAVFAAAWARRNKVLAEVSPWMLTRA